ncbi:MAG: T9SS type A sorting domain-containing protein [Bacteroidia bacterium]|nr:T9SS type A sorting domain-containing protein [Bacteroidia bacterium]
MKIRFLTLALLLLTTFAWVKGQENFSIHIEEMTIPGMPGLQSMVSAQWNGTWLLLGGRTDGLHQRQPFASFLAADNNTTIYVVDPNTKQVWSAALSSLPTSLYEQLQSTNMGFEQVNNMLYIVGGYGFSTTENDHITYPHLTAVQVDGLITAIKNSAPITPYFRQITDNRMRVTGGYLDRMGNTFYLVGGQDFEGRYNPMGPTHGPGFFQAYTNEIRMFEIQDNGTTLSIINYTSVQDTMELHRRDYNMAPQIFPDGSRGFTAFSGVFQHNVNLPWHNIVDIKSGGSYTPNPTFNQYLSQYHSAHLAVHDSAARAMHTVFFGGISRYQLDTVTNTLIDDQNVPFVKTISRVSRWSNGNVDEFRLPVDMPALLGSGAEFLPLPTVSQDEFEIIKLNDLPTGTTLVGHIVGGIESSAANIFFSNTGTQSDATTRVFKVFITKDGTNSVEEEIPNEAIELEAFPNPSSGRVNLEINSHFKGEISLTVVDQQGRTIDTLLKQEINPGKFPLIWEGSNLARGIYFVKLQAGSYVVTRKVLLK